MVIVAPVSNNARNGMDSDSVPDSTEGLDMWAVRRIWRSTIGPRKVGTADHSTGTGSM